MSHSVIFCGTPEFALPSLQALLDDESFDVTLVITQPDRPAGRKRELTPPAVKILAQERGISVFQPENINTELHDYMTAQGITKPDFLIVVAYGKILRQVVLDIPLIAPINVHGSLLPRWRGASPVEHAILAGDTETGVTVQKMELELDAGPILAMRSVPITSQTTSVELRETLSQLGAELLVETLKNSLEPQPQPEPGVTICGKLTRDDGKVDPKTMTAEEIDRRVRALNPWPSVQCSVEGHDIKIIESSLTDAQGSVPLLCTKGTTLYLVTVQEAGKKPMNALDWKRGLR